MFDAVAEFLKKMRGLILADLGFLDKMALLDFGVAHEIMNWRGKKTSGCDIALHVNCGWRLVRSNALVVGSDDIHYLAFREPGCDTLDESLTLRDWLRGRLVAGEYGQFEVVKAEIGQFHSLSIAFANSAIFEAIPLASSRDPDTELWRLFVPGVDCHLVAKASGIIMEGGMLLR